MNVLFHLLIIHSFLFFILSSLLDMILLMNITDKFSTIPKGSDYKITLWSPHYYISWLFKIKWLIHIGFCIPLYLAQEKNKTMPCFLQYIDIYTDLHAIVFEIILLHTIAIVHSLIQSMILTQFDRLCIRSLIKLDRNF